MSPGHRPHFVNVRMTRRAVADGVCGDGMNHRNTTGSCLAPEILRDMQRCDVKANRVEASYSACCKEGGTRRRWPSLRLRSCGLLARVTRPKPLPLEKGCARGLRAVHVVVAMGMGMGMAMVVRGVDSGGEQQDPYLQDRGGIVETRVVSDITRSKGAARTGRQTWKHRTPRRAVGVQGVARQLARISAGAWAARSTVEDRQGVAQQRQHSPKPKAA